MASRSGVHGGEVAGGRWWSGLLRRPAAAGRRVSRREQEAAALIWHFAGTGGADFLVVRLGGEVMLWRRGDDGWRVSGDLVEVLWEIDRMTSGIGD